MSDKHRIFVFGSNLAGIHGKGAALHAKIHYGAVYGKGLGHVGKSYAIPTKDRNIQTLPLATITRNIDEFLIYSMSNPRLHFNVTQIGCGLAGYKPEQIAPLFNIPPSASQNLWFDPEWEAWLPTGQFWNGPL